MIWPLGWPFFRTLNGSKGFVFSEETRPFSRVFFPTYVGSNGKKKKEGFQPPPPAKTPPAFHPLCHLSIRSPIRVPGLPVLLGAQAARRRVPPSARLAAEDFSREPKPGGEGRGKVRLRRSWRECGWVQLGPDWRDVRRVPTLFRPSAEKMAPPITRYLGCFLLPC